ncbi:MAG: discoidin domain-containing protein [Proteobacteria bacterium]|nr:discoidin domain-containing protein [Pseudomonadota bacterium]
MQRSLRPLALSIIPFLAVACDYVIPPEADSAEWSEGDAPDGAADRVGECAPVQPLHCGSVVGGDTSDANSGHTTVMDSYPVATGTFDGPEIAWEFVAEQSGVVSWNLLDPHPTEVDHDVFVLAGDGSCRADNAFARGHNGVDLEAVAGERYYLLIDGYDGAAGPFEAELVCGGDGGGDDTPPADPLEATTVIRIATEVSPSWVSFSEIEVMGVWASDPSAAPTNLALVASASASGEMGGAPASAAADGDPDTAWNAGDFAPAWIELELSEPALIFSIRLGIAQSPDGPTQHLLQFGFGDGPLSTVHVFEGDTWGGSWLSWLNPWNWFGGDTCEPLELNLIMEQTQQPCPDCQIWFWGMGVPEQMPRLEVDWTDSDGSHTSNYSAGPLGTDGPLMATRILAEPPWWGPGACPAGEAGCMLDFLHHFEARGTLDGAPLWYGMLRAELPNLPCDATITRAHLHLHINEDEGLANADHSSVVSFHRGTKRWSPDKVHGLRYDVDPETGHDLGWDQPGGDFGDWVLDLEAQRDFWDRGFNKANPAAWFDFTDHLVQLHQER